MVISLKDILPKDKINKWGINTDFNIREYAIAYIDNILYKGLCHYDIVENYIEENMLDATMNPCCGSVEFETMEEIDKPIILGSVIKGIDNKEYVIFYDDCNYDCCADYILTLIKKDFPHSIICTTMYTREEKEDYIKKIG